MRINLKSLVSMFLFGILLGVAVSPWLNTRPQKNLLSPVSDSYGFEGMFAREITYVENKESKMQEYFDSFDREQGIEVNTETNILGDTANANNEVKSETVKVDEEKKIVSQIVSNKKGKLKIAILGDSMVDTMGTGLPYLSKQLKARYPNFQFDLLNYGIGSENIVTANDRIESEYTYKDRSYPILNNLGADIIIIESFAYNPIGDERKDLVMQSEMIKSIVDKLKNDETKIIFLATISPIKKNFGKGPGGVNWETDVAWNHATKIQSYLENGIKTAAELGLSIIDIYHPTLLPNGEGIAKYVSKHDGIHPSEAGHEFMARMIADSLINWEMIEKN